MDIKPLCIDCDGTLIATDLLFEAFFLMLKQYPLGLFFLPFWLIKGKVYLKEKLAQHVSFNWETLPYRESVLSLIKGARKDGRPVVLVTASPLLWLKVLPIILLALIPCLLPSKALILRVKIKRLI